MLFTAFDRHQPRSREAVKVRIVLICLLLLGVAAAESMTDEQAAAQFWRDYQEGFAQAESPQDLERFLTGDAYRRLTDSVQTTDQFRRLKEFLPRSTEIVGTKRKGERLVVEMKALLPEPRRLKLLPAQGEVVLRLEDGWRVEEENWLFLKGETP